MALLEDFYKGKLVGTFGDCAVFGFSQPSAQVCGEGGMIVTDDDERAAQLRAGCAAIKSRSAPRSC